MSLTEVLLALVLGITGMVLVQLALSRLSQDKDREIVWKGVETVGVPISGILSWTRAIIKSIVCIQQNAQDGYQKICKSKDRPFLLPTMWMGGAVVVLPPSMLPLLNRPDSEVSSFNALIEMIQLPYMISDRDIYMNVIHFDVVRKMLTRKDVVASLASTTAQEFDVAFRESWGTSEQWTTLNGWDACGRVITRAALSVLIGLPLCRDESLLEQSRLYANSLFAGTAIINCLPPLVRPVLGPLLALRAKYYQARCEKVLVPFVEERIRKWKEMKEGGNVPNDLLQWMLPICAKAGPGQLEPSKIAMRLLALNTMFLFAMGYTFAHSVLDLYGSPLKSRAEFIAGLEAECKQVSEQHQGLSTKEAVDSLYRVDSAVRESMRLSDVGVTTFPLDVISGKVDLGNGIQVPKGVRMVFPTQPMHLDPDFYDEPHRFDAFRFSRKFEDLPESDLPEQRELLTSPTKSFLALGYGRHSCPGRWFVSQTMKQALAYVILNYDVELVGEPVKRKALLNMMMPPTEVQIRIRPKL